MRGCFPLDCAIPNAEKPFSDVLVELIVVLVILAILAAMMVPALLGYIDEARNKEYVLQARSIYMAAQSYADEQYAKSKAKLTKADLTSEEACKKIGTLADVTLDDEWLTSCYVAGTEGTDAFKIEEMSIKFPGKNDQTAYAALCGGEWTVALSATASAPADFSPKFNESLIKLSE